jgi:flagellar motor switch protein FliN/FliY
MDELAITAEDLARVTGMSSREVVPVTAVVDRSLPAATVMGTREPPQPAPTAVTARPASFAPLQPARAVPSSSNLDMLMGVTLRVTVELGRTKMDVREILQLGPGSVIELDKLAGEPVDVLVNDRLIARGEVVVIDDRFGVRITDVPSPVQRLHSLKAT